MRYRYYISHPLVCQTRDVAPKGLRIAAAEIERIVLSGISELLSSPGRLSEGLVTYIGIAGEQRQILNRAREMAADWPGLPARQLRLAIAMLCRRVTAHRERVDVEVSGRQLYEFLRGEPVPAEADVIDPGHLLLLSFPTRLCRIGQGKRLVIDAPLKAGTAGTPNPKLIKLLVRAHHLKERLRANPGTRIADLAMREKLSPSYVALLLRLTFLAPDITRAVLDGRQPAGFTAQKLVTYSGLPLAWPEQREALGFI